MRTTWKVLLTAAAAALVACQTCTDETPWPALADEPLGARCAGDGDCAAGLGCLDRTCTVSCAGGLGCPAGSSCISDHTCLPPCTGDGDCLLGHTAGWCLGALGDEPGFCVPRPCSSDAACPAGRCAGLSAARGVTWNDTCTDGTCMQ